VEVQIHLANAYACTGPLVPVDRRVDRREKHVESFMKHEIGFALNKR